MKRVLTPLLFSVATSVSAQSSESAAWQAPDGWAYMLTAGAPEIYRLYEEPGEASRVMDIYSHQSAAILTRDVSVPLDDDTTIDWVWRVDQLPSEVAEDTAETHDYVSVAVLFDNGQDLSYVWSRVLPEAQGFRCPLPDWEARETHVVVRSGEAELMQWLAESRNLKADYERYIGGEVPARVEQVWLITVSLFRGGTAKAAVRSIGIRSAGGDVSEAVL